MEEVRLRFRPDAVVI